MDRVEADPAVPVGLAAATAVALQAAPHLADDRFAGAKAALMALARKIDAWDQMVQWAVADVADRKGVRPAVPQNDNVSIASYAKLSEQMGLTPSGAKALQQPTRAGAAPERKPAEPDAAPVDGDEEVPSDGRTAAGAPDKAATITELRARRSVPRSG